MLTNSKNKTKMNSKEKLELKHIAPYLPYGLKFDRYGELRGIRNWIGWCCEFVDKHGSNNVPIGSAKPILRPLSDFTKEIEHNRLNLIPKIYLNAIFPGEMIGLNPATWSHRVIEKLVEWHFDVFGLIEKGLAISIHDVNLKNYKN